MIPSSKWIRGEQKLEKIVPFTSWTLWCLSRKSSFKNIVFADTQKYRNCLVVLESWKCSCKMEGKGSRYTPCGLPVLFQFSFLSSDRLPEYYTGPYLGGGWGCLVFADWCNHQMTSYNTHSTNKSEPTMVSAGPIHKPVVVISWVGKLHLRVWREWTKWKAACQRDNSDDFLAV